MTEPNNQGPLTGIRVVEVGSFIAGPFCGQLLADLGADVIKIEPPGVGDVMRQWGVAQLDGKSLWWPVIARNKRSMTLDLRGTAGQEIARSLINQADILVENFRPGTLERWGLGPDDLHKTNPGLIIARVSGFGQTGPYSQSVGFGAIAEAMGGLRTLAGFPDRAPPRAGLSIGDSLAGVFAALGVTSALEARRRTGKGQVVDVGITDAVLAMQEAVLSEFSATGSLRQRTGTALPGIAPSNLYPTGDDEWILIGGNGDAIFARLAQAMGQPELAKDERYATHRARGARQQELDDIVADWTRTLPLAGLLDILKAHNVPSGPLYDAAGIVADPHFRERGAVVDVESTEYGRLTMQGIAPHLSDTPGSVRWVGPTLGEHTQEVLADRLGLSPEEIEKLKAAGVI
ncbi:succinyl-CoA--D-citramalate CoA-transferase [Azorhizobium oxalatiphilum]|uniref:Succinyl-CoA--D-citramalate CoA-transferase n=1 Tax=Azorhizobium oxalatiphilum TaxID=980631 RepID=A0A917FIH6_9HYPH|nr:CaiB/BaiF CoA-transferase family protein [Azorhizobium oxalatiphilum]GGF82480.1 succinyl-CoA--D-citramalate CoA-transferase [Azorhizobium oxalatiphilum]